MLGLSAVAMPGPYRPRAGDVPDELLKEQRSTGPARAHEAEMRRLLHVAMTRARKGARARVGRGRAEPGATPRPSPFYEEARAALGVEEEVFEEELFGPAEGLHSTFRLMRDELLDTVARVGGRLGEMRLDTYLDVDQAVARYLELIKVAALIERAREGQTLDEALPEVNEILAQGATAGAARDPRRVRPRRLAARRRARPGRRPGRGRRTAPSRRSTPSSPAAAAG